MTENTTETTEAALRRIATECVNLRAERDRLAAQMGRLVEAGRGMLDALQGAVAIAGDAQRIRNCEAALRDALPAPSSPGGAT